MLVELPLSKPEERLPYEEVAGCEPVGASPRGSTYWRRVQMCPREHLLANQLRWEPVPRANALDIGLLWHGVLEAYYLGIHDLQRGRYRPTSPAQDAFAFLQLFRDEPGWGDFYDTCSRMLDSYLERWRNDDSWEILAVEYTCGFTEATHPEIVKQVGFECTTRLDLLVRDYSLRPVIRHIEHKSSYALNPLVIQGYSQDDQVLGQCYLGRYWFDWGHEHYAGAIINLTTKGKEPKSERLPVQPSDDQLAAWAKSKRFWCAFEKNYAELDWPKNFANCTRRFGRCQFFDLCRAYPTWEPREVVGLDIEPPHGYRSMPGPVEDAGED